jgi:pimeloyl-ACP methyl ester carboxylesterase
VKRPAVVAVMMWLLALGVAFAQPPATESGFVQVEDDVRLFYQRFGSGTPRVFISNRHEVLGPFAPLLYFHDIVLYDPRGRGLSDRPDDLSRYGLDVEVDDIEALRRHFGSERIIYVGHSLWGMVSILYAARFPDHVERVVAVGPLEVAFELGAPPDRTIEHDLSAQIAEKEAMERDGRSLSQPYAYCTLEKWIGAAEGYVNLSSTVYNTAANLCQYANEYGDQILPVVFEGILGAAGEWDLRGEAATVSAPVLLLFGDHDWSLDGIRAYADYLQDVGWLEVADAGHGVGTDRPDVVVPMLDTFFRGEWPEGVIR